MPFETGDRVVMTAPEHDHGDPPDGTIGTVADALIGDHLICVRWDDWTNPGGTIHWVVRDEQVTRVVSPP